MNRKDLPAPNHTCEVCGHKYYRCKKCIEMKYRGIETWRVHCDSIECYQILTFVNEAKEAKVDDSLKTEYERIRALELPDGRKPVGTIAEELRAIKKRIQSDGKGVEENVSVDKSNSKYDKRNATEKDAPYTTKADKNRYENRNQKWDSSQKYK